MNFYFIKILFNSLIFKSLKHKLIIQGSRINVRSALSSGSRKIEYKMKKLKGEDAEESESKLLMLKKKLEFKLPWWCKIVAYCIALGMIAVSAFFILIKGIEFGDEKVKRWISSLLMSFLSELFLTEPLKIVVLAAIFVFITGEVGEEDELDDEEEEEEKEEGNGKFPSKSNYLNQDEQWLHFYEVDCF